MRKLIYTVVFINVLAAFLVLILRHNFEYFASIHLQDYLFYMFIIIWGIAGLSWEGGRLSKNYDIDKVTRKTQSMVSDHDFQSDKHEQYRANYHFGFTMFIAGLPSFVGCVIVYLW